MASLTIAIPRKRARRDYLTEAGPPVLLEKPSTKQQILQTLLEQQDNSTSVSEETNQYSHREDAIRAAAELNQLLNLTQLLRTQEYLTLLPVQRQQMGVKQQDLPPSEQIQRMRGHLSSALQSLQRGKEQAQHVIQRRRALYSQLTLLRPRWNFLLAPPNDTHSWENRLFIDCSFGRDSRESTSLLLPLNIEDVPATRETYYTLQFSLTTTSNAPPLASIHAWTLLQPAVCEGIERVAQLSRHGLLAHTVMDLLRRDLAVCKPLHLATQASLTPASATSPPTDTEALFTRETFSHTLLSLGSDPGRLALALSPSAVLHISLVPITPTAASPATHSPLQQDLSVILLATYKRVHSILKGATSPQDPSPAAAFTRAKAATQGRGEDSPYSLLRGAVDAARLSLQFHRVEAALRRYAESTGAVLHCAAREEYLSPPTPSEARRLLGEVHSDASILRVASDGCSLFVSNQSFGQEVGATTKQLLTAADLSKYLLTC